jgi:glucokinase
MAVPGPVLNGKSSPARLGWNLDVEEYKRDLGFEKVDMLNDLEASAYGMGLLKIMILIRSIQADIWKTET